MINPAIATDPVPRPFMPNQGPQPPDNNGNPIVSEIDQAHANLSEPAKQAISILGQNSGAPPPSPSPLISPAVPATAQPMQPSVADAHKAELARLTTGDTGKPGVDQISQHHGKALSILGHIGDIAESTFLPRAAMFTPGTTLNHNRLVGNAEQAVTNDETQANNASKRGLEHGQQLEQESLPEFHQAQAQNVADKAQAIQDVGEARAAASQSETQRKAEADKAKGSLGLAQHGFKLDDGGQVVPLPYEEMSQEQQAVHDLKASQAELVDANKAYADAKTKNIPAAMALAQQRIQNASHTSAIAQERLGLSEKQYEMRAHGTENGVALPGTLLTKSGETVGTGNAANVRPTAQERNKGDMADSAAEQLSDMKGIITRRPDIFGPLAGRKTDFTVWLGSQDPDAQAFRAAQTTAADHLAGTFGARSATIVHDLKQAIGSFKDNPAAALAGITQVEKAVRTFQGAGTPRTVGSNTADPPRPKGVPANATYNRQGKYWETP